MWAQDPDDIQVERLASENKKWLMEIRMLAAQERKLKTETFCYPVFVGASVLAAFGAVGRAFAFF